MPYSIDDWMAQLFWPDSGPEPDYEWAMQRIGRCEAIIWDLARRNLTLSVPAILDLGFADAAHRKRFADMARREGAAVILHWLDVAPDLRWARVLERNREKGPTFRLDVDRAMFDFMETIWQDPDERELRAQESYRISDGVPPFGPGR